MIYFQKWHEGKREFLNTNPTQSSEDDDDEDEDDSDSEVETKKVSIKAERESEEEGGDEDDYMEYITPNGTQTKSHARSSRSTGKARKKRRASKAKNGKPLVVLEKIQIIIKFGYLA